MSDPCLRLDQRSSRDSCQELGRHTRAKWHTRKCCRTRGNRHGYVELYEAASRTHRVLQFAKPLTWDPVNSTFARLKCNRARTAFQEEYKAKQNLPAVLPAVGLSCNDFQ
jgi:hypothetical protein